MPEDPKTGWGPAAHRRRQLRAWADATPARRFAWLEEMLDWLRRRNAAHAAGDRDSADDR